MQTKEPEAIGKDFILEGYAIYPESWLDKDGRSYFLAKKDFHKYLASDDTGFEAGVKVISPYNLYERTPQNAQRLKNLFKHLGPIPCGLRRSFGFGDRLGLATPGHIEAVKDKDIFPVLAQQSIREMERTGRNMQEVLDDAMWGVFQTGYRNGYGADIDHVKKEEDVKRAAEAGYTMYTIDPSDYINDQAKDMSGIYRRAIEHISRCYQLVKEKNQGPFDFEASIDETAIPTSPRAHIFMVEELRRNGVKFTSLALRFVGEFQKGIDYMGDLKVFKEQFSEHLAISSHFGGYKISIHSGSDKFSLYPVIGEESGGSFHLKTAGTSWLEAVRLISLKEPGLYRRLHKLAVDNFENDRQSYQVTTNLSKIPDIDKISDRKLPEFLEENNARQLMHITYGTLLKNCREEIYKTLNTYEKEHYELLVKHLGRHLKKAGI